MPETQLIGFIGPGIMGHPMAHNLLKAGYRLQIHSRRPEAANSLIDLGAKYCDSPQKAAIDADLIITVVSDTPDVEEVMIGPNGIIHGAKPGAIAIDMSTCSPATTCEIATQLSRSGIEMLDAPVSGGEQGAINGELSIMIGGSPKTFKKALPILDCLGKHITYVGGQGDGQIAKACNQILAAQMITAVAEALSLARATGVDPEKVREALLGGFAYSKILEVHGQRMLDGNYTPGFKAKLHHKDIRIAQDIASTQKLDLKGTELAGTYINQLVSKGLGELDSAAIIKMIELP